MKITSLPKKRLFLIDNQPIYFNAMEELLESNEDFELVGTCKTFAEADEGIALTSPHLILFDIALAKSQGIQSIKSIRKSNPAKCILIFSDHDEGLFAERCLKAGANGYIDKKTGISNILEAAQLILDGKMYVSDRVKMLMLQKYGASKNTDNLYDYLSDRELLIVQHIGQSKDNYEIAQELQTSVKTIESHRSRIRNKLKLNSPNDLIRHAIKLHQAMT